MEKQTLLGDVEVVYVNSQNRKNLIIFALEENAVLLTAAQETLLSDIFKFKIRPDSSKGNNLT